MKELIAIVIREACYRGECPPEKARAASTLGTVAERSRQRSPDSVLSAERARVPSLSYSKTPTPQIATLESVVW
jgi:hypothetical protein